MSIENEKNFNFAFPVDLYKGKTEGEWRVRGIASTEHLDLQGEVVRQNGLDITPLKEGNGLFNWDHKDGPQNILGCIDLADKTAKGLYVEGYLFKDSDQAKSVYNILKSLKPKDKRRLQMSIEGKILKRGNFNEKEVAVARIDKVALTFNPVNTNTYAELVKSLTANSETPLIHDLLNNHTHEVSTNNEVEIAETQVNPILTTQDEIKGIFKSTLLEVLSNKDIGQQIYEHKTISESISQTKTTTEENKVVNEVKKSELESDPKLSKADISQLITNQIINFAKSRSPILSLGQEILESQQSEAESKIYQEFKKSINDLDEANSMLLLPKVMMCWNDETPIFKKALEFLKAIKKALTTGDSNVAPQDLTDGASLTKESLKTKHKKKKKEEHESSK